MTSMNQSNPLLYPPFFLIPGINPSSPISAQLEQIDQLNTLLLQEIDANFAKFHQVVTSRILPEIKRLAIAGEPTREAAAFWRSFFEAAAAVRVPIPGDFSHLNSGTQDVTTYDDQTMTLHDGGRANESYLSARAREEGSFMFDPPPTSSTPLPNRATISGGIGIGGAGGGDVSWDDSMESPFDRMDRKLRDELNIADEVDVSGVGSVGQGTSDMPTPSLPSGYSLPPLDNSAVSSHTFIHQGHGNTTGLQGAQGRGEDDDEEKEQGTPRATTRRVLPIAGGIKLSSANPFATSNDRKWNGIADLRSTPLNPRIKGPGTGTTGKSTGKGKSVFGNMDDLDDDDDLQYAMSPPVTMTFNLPPRAQGILNAGRTPIKSTIGSVRSGDIRGTSNLGDENVHDGGAISSGGGRSNLDLNSALGSGTTSVSTVADPTRVVEDLLDEITNGYVPSPRLPTPAGLGRYSVMPDELDAVLGSGRRLFDPNPTSTSTAPDSNFALAAESSSNVRPVEGREPRIRRSLANTSYGSDIQVSSTDPSDPGRVINDDESFDEYGDDTFSSAGGAGGVTDAHAAAGAGFEFVDESYVTDAGDESRLGSAPGEGIVAGGQGTTGGEASLIFGHPVLPPGQMKRGLALGGGVAAANFLMKSDEMLTFHGGRLEDARLTDSPTKGAR